jgi:hypothetical protein
MEEPNCGFIGVALVSLRATKRLPAIGKASRK